MQYGRVAMLVLVVGLPGAGKTTRAKELAAQHHAIRLTPDEWMIPLFGLCWREPSAWGKRDVLEGPLISIALQAMRLDLPKVKDCIRDPAHFKAALGHYWGQFDPDRFGSEEWAAEQAAAWGKDITQPTLYLHGTQDGCHGMTQEQVDRVPQHCGTGTCTSWPGPVQPARGPSRTKGPRDPV
jgi:pimeloyl-ACP methyl ester carboxylesterase